MPFAARFPRADPPPHLRKDPMIRAPCHRLAAIADPFARSPWSTLDRLTREAVDAAIAAGNLAHEPVGADASATLHIARIAWLVQNPADDPIQVDLGCPSFPGWRPFWPITDGNHRFAAALYRRDETIALEWGGEVDLARRTFGADLIDAEILAYSDEEAVEEPTVTL